MLASIHPSVFRPTAPAQRGIQTHPASPREARTPDVTSRHDAPGRCVAPPRKAAFSSGAHAFQGNWLEAVMAPPGSGCPVGAPQYVLFGVWAPLACLFHAPSRLFPPTTFWVITKTAKLRVFRSNSHAFSITFSHSMRMLREEHGGSTCIPGTKNARREQ